MSMKVGTKGRYGLTLMLHLAKKYSEARYISLKSIAQDNHLSDHYLEQLVGPLRNDGLVVSIRGAHGGYKLAKPANEITVGQIIRLLEGPIEVVTQVENEPIEQQILWQRMTQAIKEVLDCTTLQDLIDEQHTILNDYMFYI